jgi:RNA polymerase sigma-70 factor (ECF subfamily)
MPNQSAAALRLPEPATAPADEEIVARVVAGERALFELLMRRHNRRVYRAVRAILRDEAESEDAMQAAYLAAYAHLDTFRGGAAFSTWLTRIAVNEALGRLRRGGRLVPVDELPEAAEPPAADSPNPEHRAAARELVAVLEAAVDRLPADYRAIFVLRDVEGLSTEEAAASLGIGEALAKVRLLRARRALRRALAELLGAEAPAAFAFDAVRCDRIVAAVMARI